MFKSRIHSQLDVELAFLLKELETLRDDSEKYATNVERISKLEKLRPERVRPLSLDTVVIAGANIFGILWLARYEKENVIKSQSAFRMILKP